MANPAAKQTARKKAVRIALIPLLVGVLLAVFFWPDDQPDFSEAASPDDNAAQASAMPAGELNTANGLDALATRRQHQPMELSRILEHDPFALPTEVSKELITAATPTEKQAADRERARIAAVVERLQRKKLSVVYRDDKGVSARLGKRVLHEGDEIEAGIRILKITPQGLTLEVTAETAPETAVE